LIDEVNLLPLQSTMNFQPPHYSPQIVGEIFL
jgi:hypothetical protein